MTIQQPPSQDDDNYIFTTRDVPVVQIPNGTTEIMKEGTELQVMYQLGPSFTLRTLRTLYGAMYRLEGVDADAINLPIPKEILIIPDGDPTPQLILTVLEQCYDPEIPVSIVALGLVYNCIVQPAEDGYLATITMTATAPGCGMTQWMVDDVKRKLNAIPLITQAEVDLVFDPPWTPDKMTEAARLELGLM